MTSTPRTALLVAALSASLFLWLGTPSSLRADDGSSAPRIESVQSTPPAEDDVRGMLVLGAAFSSGFFAFDLALQLSDLEAFGPRPIVTASLVASSVGLVLSHVGALALLDRGIYRDPRQRDLFTGLSLLGTSLGLLGFSIPSCFAVTSGPIPDDPESIAIVAPFFLAAIGVAGLVTGAVLVGTSAEAAPVRVGVAASTEGATLVVSGVF